MRAETRSRATVKTRRCWHSSTVSPDHLPGSIDDLEAEEVVVRRDARFVDGGQTVTSGAVSTGIDLAFHLVA
jgi:hypothetical protein